MVGSAKQQWASLTKGLSTPKSLNKWKFDDKSYDSTERKRKFIPRWRNLFSRMEYNSDEGIMFCITCRKLPLHADNSSALYVGSTNFWIESLKTHNTSTHHHLCSSKIKQELYPTNLQDTHLGQAVIQLHENKEKTCSNSSLYLIQEVPICWLRVVLWVSTAQWSSIWRKLEEKSWPVGKHNR